MTTWRSVSGLPLHPLVQAALDNPDAEPNVRHQHDGTVRTSMNCHACSKTFLALIDHNLGRSPLPPVSLVISCPHCNHKHHRKIKNGVVTDERDGSDDIDAFQGKVKTWKHETLPASSSTTSEFLRHRWLNLHQSGG